jgi:uncharacterized membrane protein
VLCFVVDQWPGVFPAGKDNKFIRFHALQSIIAFGILTLAGIVVGWIARIPFFGWLIGFAFWILCLMVWIICMVKAFQGEKFKLPWAGNLAEKNLKPAGK